MWVFVVETPKNKGRKKGRKLKANTLDLKSTFKDRKKGRKIDRLKDLQK